MDSSSGARVGVGVGAADTGAARSGDAVGVAVDAVGNVVGIVDGKAVGAVKGAIVDGDAVDGATVEGQDPPLVHNQSPSFQYVPDPLTSITAEESHRKHEVSSIQLSCRCDHVEHRASAAHRAQHHSVVAFI